MLASVLLSRLNSSSTDRSALYDSRSPAAWHIAVKLPDASRTNAASHAMADALPAENQFSFGKPGAVQNSTSCTAVHADTMSY